MSVHVFLTHFTVTAERRLSSPWLPRMWAGERKLGWFDQMFHICRWSGNHVQTFSHFVCIHVSLSC
jgi:hypothetical protein